jgi:hypothetical protein
VQQEVALENFIHEQNLAMFKRFLADEPNMDQKRREMILRLLANEKATVSTHSVRTLSRCGQNEGKNGDQ